MFLSVYYLFWLRNAIAYEDVTGFFKKLLFGIPLFNQVIQGIDDLIHFTADRTYVI